MVTLTLVGRRPAANPDTLLVKAVLSGNSPAADGDVDLMDLTAILDPDLIGGPYPTLPPSTPIEVLSTSMQNAGTSYDVQVIPNAAPTLKNFGLMVFSAGVQVANGEAYPAGVLNGSVLLGIHLAEVSA